MRPIDKILLVDDDDVFVYLTELVIQESGFKGDVKVCVNGKAAIDYLAPIAEKETLLPNIIFLDLSMPVLDGWGFLEEFILLKPRLAHKIAIYISSSSVSPYDVQRAKGISEVSDFIVKPVTKDKFNDILRNLQAA